MPNNRYAFIDPEIRTFVISSEVPDTVGFWSEVSPDVDPNALAVSSTGEIIVMPVARQYPWQEPDGAGGWTDTRNEDEIAHARVLARNQASLSRIEFLLAAKNAGLITEADAEAAAESKIPPSMLPLFDAMTPEQQFEAKIRWKAATIIERMNPFILQWAGILGVTDEQLDALFNVTI